MVWIYLDHQCGSLTTGILYKERVLSSHGRPSSPKRDSL